jgi:tetratricopeptide (TPR) repeat protein
LQAQENGAVKMREGVLKLPTYLVNAPEKAPSFSRNFAYQRAKRGVYPYAMNDNVTNDRVEQEHKALFLENEYLELCVLPDIGGRLLYAIDKTNNYDIFYRQHVVKPSNVGMLGAWISGGVEFNVFHHHRASSHLPVDYQLVANTDGSKTIWIGEIEPRHRMSWAIGMTLYPGKSYIEVTGRLVNETANKNSFLYWSNVSTASNDDYQIIFPESTDFGVYHAKNSFVHWPVSHEPYLSKSFYNNNIDVSWWKNHPDPVSIFAYDLKDDFIAGYDYGKQAGTMLVGNHNIVKGGKMWEWGPGNYGKKWDNEVLTDSDGSYVELMVGAYSDNQPDYSWLNPYETKSFTKYWYGIRNTQGAKMGNIRASLNMDITGTKAFIAAHTTQKEPSASIVLKKNDGTVLFTKIVNIAPDQPFSTTVAIPGNFPKERLTLSLSDKNGKELIAYTPVVKDASKPLPEEVKPPLKPQEIANSEECYLVGLRNKQFHNAFINPNDYFEEVLLRDPDDTRSNTQMGIYYRENGDYERAAEYFRRAIRRLTKDYTRPRDCEALYNLGLILKEQRNYTEAIDTLYRAAWDYAYASAAYFQLAQISVNQGNIERALEELAASLSTNAENLQALNLQTSLLRSLNQIAEAQTVNTKIGAIDPMNRYAVYEKSLLSGQSAEFTKIMRDLPESYLELAISYLHNGFADEALKLFQTADKITSYPTIKYWLGHLADANGNTEMAKRYFTEAANLPIDYCFPFRLETVNAYEKAMEYLPDAANTYYYMGNLFFDKQPDKAMTYWQKAVEKNPNFAMAYRNLGWAYKFHEKDAAKAIANYEKAISLDASQAVFFTELDEVYESANINVQKRYELLSRRHATVQKRYDSFVREIRMTILACEYDKAIELLTSRFFSRQEGVNDLHDIYVDACLLAGKAQIEHGNTAKAYAYFLKADEYPDNQCISRDERYDRNSQVYYYIGLAAEQLGKKFEAKKYYRLAADNHTLNVNIYDYERALAKQKLDKKVDVSSYFDALIQLGQSEITEEVDNFFVSFGPGKTEAEVNSAAYYTLGLGYLGKGDAVKAKAYFAKAVSVKADNLWAIVRMKS